MGQGMITTFSTSPMDDGHAGGKQKFLDKTLIVTILGQGQIFLRRDATIVCHK
jgi:hypothetical protein